MQTNRDTYWTKSKTWWINSGCSYGWQSYQRLVNKL